LLKGLLCKGLMLNIAAISFTLLHNLWEQWAILPVIWVWICLYLDVLVSCFWNHSCNILLTGFVSGGHRSNAAVLSWGGGQSSMGSHGLWASWRGVVDR
jgi:hypothetical protein